MIPFGESGYLIDTPGIKGFGTIDFEREEVGHYFPEIFKASGECFYGNCTHTHEPKCAVRELLNAGKLPTLVTRAILVSSTMMRRKNTGCRISHSLFCILIFLKSMSLPTPLGSWGVR